MKLDLDAKKAEELHLVHFENFIEDKGGKKLVVMKAFITSLDMVPYYSEEVVLTGVKGIQLAMQHLHSKNIVHMDIKPANILLDAAGQWFLCDYES